MIKRCRWCVSYTLIAPIIFIWSRDLPSFALVIFNFLQNQDIYLPSVSCCFLGVYIKESLKAEKRTNCGKKNQRVKINKITVSSEINWVGDHARICRSCPPVYKTWIWKRNRMSYGCNQVEKAKSLKLVRAESNSFYFLPGIELPSKKFHEHNTTAKRIFNRHT